jgi:hypothetical protein
MFGEAVYAKHSVIITSCIFRSLYAYDQCALYIIRNCTSFFIFFLLFFVYWFYLFFLFEIVVLSFFENISSYWNSATVRCGEVLKWYSCTFQHCNSASYGGVVYLSIYICLTIFIDVIIVCSICFIFF